MMRPRTYTRAWYTSVNNVRKAGQKGYRVRGEKKANKGFVQRGGSSAQDVAPLRRVARPPPLERGECFPKKKLFFIHPLKSLYLPLCRVSFVLYFFFFFPSLFLFSSFPSFNSTTGKRRAEKHASVSNEKEKERERGKEVKGRCEVKNR